MNKRIAVVLGAALFLIALANWKPAATSADGPPVTFLAEIINDFTTPVPVSGEVNATVGGTVDVATLPAEVIDKLDEIVAELEQIKSQPSGPAPASFVKRYAETTGGFFSVDFESVVLVSTLIVSSENDEATFGFNVTGESDGVSFGSEGQTLPPVLTFNFPHPFQADGFVARCRNVVEECEFRVSVIGTVAE